VWLPSFAGLEVASNEYAGSVSLFVRVPHSRITAWSPKLLYGKHSERVDKIETRNTAYREELEALSEDEDWREVDSDGNARVRGRHALTGKGKYTIELFSLK
jgi:hypothetical protein